MKHPRLSLLFALVFALLCGTPSVAHVEWDALNREVQELFRAGEYDRAVVVTRDALRIAEQDGGPDHPDVATSLNNLAFLYQTRGDYAAAEPLYTHALAIFVRAHGPDHPDAATSLENLAAAYRATERRSEAEALERRAARIRAVRR
jgi:tetratricopeptide (TPR) repeat protein